MSEKRENVGRCGQTAPGLGETMVGPCRLDAGHAGWHRADDGSEWGPVPRPPIESGLVVRQGDTLVLVVPGDSVVDEATVAMWTEHMGREMPDGVKVMFVAGVTPVVVRGQG